jgi:hypothetical protein
MQQNTDGDSVLCFSPHYKASNPLQHHREEEEVQPVFGVERNLPCTDQILKTNTHNKQSLLSAKKFLVLDLSSPKTHTVKTTLSEADHIEKETTTTTDQNTNTERQRQRDRETGGESNL